MDDLIRKTKRLLSDESRRDAIARAGAEMMAKVWSKERQWDDFVSLVART